MKRYTAYKSYATQLYQLAIPEHWKWLYGNACFFENTEKFHPQTRPTLLQFQYGKIVPKPMQNVWDGDISVYEKYTAVHPHMIMLNGLNLNYDFVSQRVAEVTQTGIITSAYISMCCRPDYNVKYAVYLLKTIDAQKIFHGMGTGIRLTLSFADIKKMQFPIPPLPEQQQIVRYLDWQTAQIDKAIRGYERLLALLEERKTAVINEAVTQGIRRDVLLKDSGVNWLDRIPQHWQMRYAKQLFSLRRDRAGENDEQLTSSQKYGIISQKEFMEREGRRVTVVLKGEDILKHVESGDFVISMRSFQGGLEYSTVSGKISSAYVMLIPNHELVYDRYFRWLFKSESYIRALQGTSDLIRDGQALRYANFAKVYLPCIPLNEQKEIADYIDMSVEHIDNAMAPIQRQIDLLRERRTRLIADVVTGQVDVRDIAVPAVAAETEVMTDGDEYDGAGA